MRCDDEPGYGVATSTHAPEPAATPRHQTKSPATAKPRRLSNNAINFIVDAVMLVAFMVMLTLTAIVQFIFSDAPTAAGWTLWSLNRVTWQRMLSGSVAVFGLLVLLHLILHWSWVCSFVGSRLSKALGRPVVINESARTIWGVATLIFVLTCIAAVLMVAEFCVVTTK